VHTAVKAAGRKSEACIRLRTDGPTRMRLVSQSQNSTPTNPFAHVFRSVPRSALRRSRSCAVGRRGGVRLPASQMPEAVCHACWRGRRPF
jgi:hypothetical protein